jgi:crossover junction endodeoxyribonuclease RusA
MIAITLPWPPTANTYWRHPTTGKLAGRHLISASGRTYRTRVYEAVVTQLRCFPRLSGRLRVSYRCAPPDLRKRDLSNLLKATEDALTHAGVWNDDGQIDEIHMVREFPEKFGSLHVQIEEISV